MSWVFCWDFTAAILQDILHQPTARPAHWLASHNTCTVVIKKMPKPCILPKDAQKIITCLSYSTRLHFNYSFQHIPHNTMVQESIASFCRIIVVYVVSRMHHQMSYGQDLVHGERTSLNRVGPYRFCSEGNPTTLAILLWSYLILSDTPMIRMSSTKWINVSTLRMMTGVKWNLTWKKNVFCDWHSLETVDVYNKSIYKFLNA